jgi:hypothetical protein
MTPHIFNLSIRWRRVVIFTLRPLDPRGKSPRYPLYSRLDVPQSLSGLDAEEENILSLPLPRIEPHSYCS